MKAKIKDKDIVVTPVKKYAMPKYPTRVDANRTPELLRKLPSRWEKNAKVVAAIGMLGAMTLTSCGVLKTDGAGQGQETRICEETCEETGYLAGDVIMEIPAEQESEEYFALEGNLAVTGFTTEQDYVEPEETETATERSFFDTSYIMPAAGGIGPPSYISETDVYTIITEMAATNGLSFEKLPPNLENEDERPYRSIVNKLYDSEKQVGVEYSGALGYWAGEPYISSDGIAVGSFDIAGYHNEFGIMYEEFGQKIKEITFDENSEEYHKKYDEAYAEYETKMQFVLKEDLREQVRDFIEWLQGQGII